MEQISNNKLWSNSIEFWLNIMNSNSNGLNEKEVNQRQLSSRFKKKKKSEFEKDFLLFINQFKSPLMLLLLGAVILSAFLGDTSDVFIILFIVLSTGIMSFLQERNAGKVVEKLQSLIAQKCTVLRNNLTQEINSNQLVIGDIILLKAGDLIPADCRILESNELHINEASLTGESYPVSKKISELPENTELAKRYNCLWEGTNVVSGTAKALVINTGENTIFGSIAQSINANIETTFEKGIKDFGYFLMKITIFLSIFILVINLLNHKSIIDSALFALALAVGMAPELLPAINTIAMSAGAKRLLEQKVIVKKLASIQNLGEVNLLCTDKTGTITEGAINVSQIIDAEGNPNNTVKEMAFWNAKLESGYANPIDEALKNMTFSPLWNTQKQGEIPYDFIRKRLSIAIQIDKKNILICKGAYNQIKAICSKVLLSNGEIASINPLIEKIESDYIKFGIEGYRAIAICYKAIENNRSIDKSDETEMIFAGFILLQDPVKDGIKETINELKKLSVDLKIITGDNKNVALSIAKSLGINTPQILTGQELLSTSPEALKQLAKHTHIFAEVEPQQKERIIIALKQSFTVAYIGDGINDVSAINAADVGISVDNAVDVAREAADFVLLEKNLMVLVKGILEGRKTFANTLKYIFINTGSTFGNMFSVAFASLILPFLPMLPKQILLTNFITDFPYLSIASDNVDKSQLNKPGKWNLKLIRNYMVIFGIHSSVFDIITFSTLLFILKVKESAFQTAWFVESILTELFILFIIRTHKNFFNSKPGNSLFLLSLLGLILTIGLPYMPFANDIGLRPLPLINLLTMLLIVFLYIITADLLKVWFFKKHK